jgi:hypothetical protein
MSKPKPQFQPSNVLLVEVPPQFIALCEARGASPQAALRGMAAMLCGLQYDADNRLVPLRRPRRVSFTRAQAVSVPGVSLLGFRHDARL